MEKWSVTWLGHACFRISYSGYDVVIDPYRDGAVPGLAPLRLQANKVLCSHAHDDHGYVQAVMVRPCQPCPFQITAFDSWHDEACGQKRGKNIIHLLEAGGIRGAHLGDLGCGLTSEQIQALIGLDVLMIPIGGTYTIDARQAWQIAQELKPTVLLPMHYRTDRFGYPVLTTLDEFLVRTDGVMTYPSNAIEITKETKQQTAVLTYLP